uniref:Uncharacterized protein n=1 Tax=Cyprinus carpio TaxID=7962 RepID=A0A8C2A877_CYPCA
IACVVGGSLVSLYAVTGPFVAPALRKNENALKVLKTRSGSLVDIGSGHGRILKIKNLCMYVFAFLLYFIIEGVHHNTSFYISDLWKGRIDRVLHCGRLWGTSNGKTL